MKRKLLACLWALACPAAALAVDAGSRIAAVTVYPNGAAVTRVAVLDLPAGTTGFRLSGLVDDIDPQSLRATLDAPGVQLGELRFGREQRRDAFNAEVERLSAAIETAETRITAIDDAIKGAELQLKFLDSLAQGYAKEAWLGGARGTADVASWRQALELLQTASGEAYTDIRRQRELRGAAERDLSVLRRELADLRGTARASAWVSVAISAPRATTAELRLTYFQDDAYWRPQYEARLDSDGARLTLAQQALVVQETAEAWDDVALFLSTSDPSGALEPGEMDSEFLDLAEPRPAAPAARQMLKLQSGVASDVLEEVVVAGNRIVPQIGSFAVTYEIPGRVTVPNDADESQSYDVSSVATGVELVTRVLPRESDRAFLAARFDYDGDLPLYAGTMRVYVDGAYAGMTDMPTVLPDAKVTLPMGDDSRVVVRVSDRGRDRGREGIVSRRRTETASYLFEIGNRRPSPAQIEVVDRYPVARNRDIEVEIPRDVTPPAETDVDDRPGVILWRRTLEPGETWRIEHGYTVSYPADKTLTRR